MRRGFRHTNRLFVLTLMWTGTRISECLALTPSSFQLAEGVVSVITLKRRALVVREVPLPEWLLCELDHEFFLLERQKHPIRAHQPLWEMSRTTAWRIVKAFMREAGIHGAAASPKGFRHGFGVGAVLAGILPTLLQRWMGHARLETTAIYLNVCGPEERALARRFWSMTQRR
jgi:integrase